MLNKELLEAQLAEFPLFSYGFIDPKTLDFTQRVRYVCGAECPMFGKSWACPPAVGEVEECKSRCMAYANCLMIATITEISDIANVPEALATRAPHEAITNEIAELMRRQGVDPYILSTEACAVCERCAYLDGQPCRYPDRMHPCIESHGINVIPMLENLGLDFFYGGNIITWYSLLFFND